MASGLYRTTCKVESIARCFYQTDKRIAIVPANSLVQQAIFQKNSLCLILALARGADVEVLNNKGYTPLHVAVLENFKDGLPILLSSGASINARVVDTNVQHRKMTALHLAIENTNKEVVEFLLSKRSGYLPHEKEGNTPLHTAALFNYSFPQPEYLAKKGERVAIMQLLIAKKADINAKNCAGLTPLALANTMFKPGYDLLVASGAKV